MLKKLKKLAIPFYFLVHASASYSLPIGFAMPQADRVYKETTNPNFLIYHDSKASHEARMILHSLEAARPVLNAWFDKSRSSPLPVISSAMTSNASFANFLTGAIELQTLGQGQRDLFWHEYVHMMMFMHLENFMGHAGAIFHVPWMPAWFLEGLAEAISVSVSSERQASIERRQALYDEWPSYDRLHSLYSNSEFFEQGYATSGAFVAWLLRKGYEADENFLPNFLRSFYRYTLPDYYPISLTPINDFLPMDAALRDFLGKNGRSLYEEYKSDAKKYWDAHRNTALFDRKDLNTTLDKFPFPKIFGSDVYIIDNTNTLSIEKKLNFDPKTGLFHDQQETGLTFESGIYDISYRGDHNIGVQTIPDLKTGLPRYQILTLKKDNNTYKKDTVLVQREGQINKIGESSKYIFWHETAYEVSSICYLEKSEIDTQEHPFSQSYIQCPLSETMPQSLEIIGMTHKLSKDKYYNAQIWYAKHMQTLQGDTHELWEWDTETNQQKKITFDTNAFPLALTQLNENLWILIAERSHRSLMKLDATGTCIGMLALDDDIASINSDKNNLILTLSLKKGFALKSIDPSQLALTTCKPTKSHISPLVIAMRSSEMGLKTALNKASLWETEKTADQTTPLRTPQEEAFPIDQTKPLGSDPSQNIIHENESAGWRPRPILALPWIGTNDALGYQLGVVSVPLMDHMQNETLYAAVLYGLASHYPNTELSLISTRFWPHLSVSAYRRQVWNGTYASDNGDTLNSFIDEKGTRFATTISAYFENLNLKFSTGLLAAHRKPFLGPKSPATEGMMFQPFALLSLSGRVKKWMWALGIDSQVTPGSWDRNFDFNNLGAKAEVKRPLPFWNSQFGLQLEAARTRGRGDKTPKLKQFYTSLKTYLPGTNSNYTANSFPVYGSTLLAPHFGDTKARAELDWSAPIIKDWDKMHWILYFYELRFSAFANYGGAWYQAQDARSHLKFAHGYSLDMLFENKGIHFNLGLGVGQVHPGPGQVYLNAGFDLII